MPEEEVRYPSAASLGLLAVRRGVCTTGPQLRLADLVPKPARLVASRAGCRADLCRTQRLVEHGHVIEVALGLISNADFADP